MKAIRKALVWVREFFFPILEPLTPKQISEEKERLNSDKKMINKLKLGKQADVVIEEARRIFDSEVERRKSADQKATTYLAVVAALIPLILSVATAVWNKEAAGTVTWISMPFLALAVVYIAWSGLWAFRVLEVSASNRLGVGDFDAACRKRHPPTHLMRSILLCTRLNQNGVNHKVSGIKMAHAFLLRAFLTFAFLLLFNIMWYFSEVLWVLVLIVWNAVCAIGS